ncbi:hypothetical protein [Colwellia piezophila]|uniref:hypothetical protein n=1 Tax=Colwellia piezophila TaxID=211668 RepID=UPI00036047A6|nr:hypothetical protein [Colwellia piezophila]
MLFCLAITEYYCYKLLQFNITYNTGETALLRGEKDGEMVSFYMNDEFVTKVSMADLNAYVENKA